MRCTAKKRLRRRGRERQRPAGAGEGQPARPARRPGRPLRRAGALRQARDGRPRPARPPGAPSGRGVRGGGRLDPDWRPWIACAARVTRLTWRKDTRTGLWVRGEEVALYVSQVRLDAATFGRAVRAHWGIENRDHHVRDRIL